MSNNPFSSPQANITVNTVGLTGIHHRVFVKSLWSFQFVFSRSQMIEGLRRDAEEFINSEVGAANVVSIVEHLGYENSVVVWYRIG